MKKLYAGILLFLLALVIDTACAAETPCFGPRHYVRTQGEPDVFTDSIASCSGAATIQVTNGNADGTLRISSATVTVDGDTLFGQRDLNQNVDTLTAEIQLVSESSLQVELYSGGGKAQGHGHLSRNAARAGAFGASWKWFHNSFERFWKWCGFGRPDSPPAPQDPFLTVTIFQAVSPPALRVQITQPLDGDEMGRRIIAVSGTVNMPDADIAVNGTPAMVMDGIFVAENIELNFGSNTLTAVGSAGDLLTQQSITVHVPGIDLEPVNLELVTLNLNDRNLRMDGIARVSITNHGTGDVAGPYHLVLFEDADLDGRFDAESDNLLAETEVPSGPKAGASMDVYVQFQGQSLFRDNHLHLQVDSRDALEEITKDNNLLSIRRPGIDVSASYVRVDNSPCPDQALLTVRIGNPGAIEIAPGLPVSFYDGDPRNAGALIGTIFTTDPLLPGAYEDVTLPWSGGATAGPVFAVADDDGGGQGIYPDGDTENSRTGAAVTVCAGPAAAPNSISGLAMDALTGDVLEGAQVTLYIDAGGVPGSMLEQVQTHSGGGFIFTDLAPGAYILGAASDGYIDSRRQVTLSADQTATHRNMVLSPRLASDEIRVVLTWSEHPRDLDAHLTGPNPDGCRHHCNYWNRQIPGAVLDVDATDGFGPETITLTKGTAGTFRYYVHDFTHRDARSAALSASGARVAVYFGSGDDPLAFEVPSMAGTVWHVFEIDGLSGRVMPIDRMAFQPEPGKIDFPVITSTPVTSLAWGTPYVYTVTAEDPDPDPLIFTLLEAPPGMHLDPRTGVLQWDPDAWQSGSRKVAIQVSDGRCGQDTQAFNLNVSLKPTATFEVTPCSGYNPGGQITLTWTSRRAETLTIEPGIGPVAANGTLTLDSPAEPTLYRLKAVNTLGSESRSVPLLPATEIDLATSDGSRVLTWNSVCAVECSITPDIGEVSCSGTSAVDAAGLGNYTLQARNAAGVAYATAIECLPPTILFSHEPVCGWSPGDPVILATRAISKPGAPPCPVSCHIDQGVGAASCNGPIEVRPTETTTYTLTVSGDPITQTVTVPAIIPPTVKYFRAARTAARPGESIRINWEIECAESISIEPGIGEVGAVGSLVVTPEALPQTYTLTAVRGSETTTRILTIRNVAPSVSFYAAPGVIKPGESATLAWSVADATTCRIEPDIGPVPTSGSIEVQPSRRTTYTLTADGPGGNQSRSATVSFVRPTVQLQAVPQLLQHGQSTTLSWIFTDADTCRLYSNFDLDIDDVPLGGSLVVTPDRPTRYTIAATGPGGTATDSVTVSFVTPTVSINAEPDAVIPGQSVILSWDSTLAETCSIAPGIGIVGPNGSMAVSPTRKTTYTITAQGPGGSATAGVTVNCLDPVIDFGPVMQTIQPGETVTLTWDVPSAQTIRLNPLGHMPATGSVTVSPTETTQYEISLAGCGWTTIRATATVKVLCPPTLSFIRPDGTNDTADTSFLLRWTLDDCGNDTPVALYYAADPGGADSTLIASGVFKNPDGSASFRWDTSTLPEGRYYIHAVIDDGHHDPVTVHAGHPVIIDRSMPPIPRITLSASDGESRNYFGSSLAVSDKYAVVGSPYKDFYDNYTDYGAVYVFKRQGRDWVETAKLFCNHDWLCQSFGSSVAVDGDTIVVGAEGRGRWTDFNAAYVFTLQDGQWVEQAVLCPEDSSGEIYFGRTVALAGDTAFIGAPAPSYTDIGGAVYLFMLQGGDWVEQVKLTSNIKTPRLFFGNSLWVDEDTLIIGTQAGDPLTGSREAAYIYRRHADAWIMEAWLMGVDSTGLDYGSRFGYSVHMKNGTAIVGSELAVEDHGAAYIFSRNPGEGGWTESARLMASDTEWGGNFGTSVWIDGDYAYVGTGASSYYSQHPGDTVYVFRHQDGVWREQKKIRPGDNGSQVNFGEKIAMANGRLLVGADWGRKDGVPVGLAYIYITCDADLEVSPATIAPGATATLTWSTELADTITIEPGIGAVEPGGSIAVAPAETTTYTLHASGPYGRTARQITLRVTTEAPAVTLNATPATITAGQSATLTWEAANATEVIIEPGIGPVAPRGSVTVAPLHTTAYTITASGPGGTATHSAQVTLLDPPETSAQIEADPAVITSGQPTVLTWTTTYADTVTIEPGIGTVASSGALAVSPDATTTYTLTAAGPYGTATDSVTVAVTSPHISIAINSPGHGETILKPFTMVEGTFVHHRGLETGVTVNGVVASIYGDVFVVNGITLEPGENTLTVVATDTEGNTATTSITVARDPDHAYIRLTATPGTGISPLDATLKISGSFMIDETVTCDISGYSITYGEQGTVDAYQIAPGEYALHITGEGIYFFTAEVEDIENNYYTDTAAILVIDGTLLDSILQDKWSGMKAALATRNIDGALDYFDEEMQGLYYDIYTALNDDLPQIVAAMQDIELVEMGENSAIYRIRKEEVRGGRAVTMSYNIYFTKDAHGIWRIYRY